MYILLSSVKYDRLTHCLLGYLCIICSIYKLRATAQHVLYSTTYVVSLELQTVLKLTSITSSTYT